MTTNRVYEVVYGYVCGGHVNESSYTTGSVPLDMASVQRYVRERFGWLDVVVAYRVWDGTDPCNLFCVRPMGR